MTVEPGTGCYPLLTVRQLLHILSILCHPCRLTTLSYAGSSQTSLGKEENRNNSWLGAPRKINENSKTEINLCVHRCGFSQLPTPGEFHSPKLVHDHRPTTQKNPQYSFGSFSLGAPFSLETTSSGHICCQTEALNSFGENGPSIKMLTLNALESRRAAERSPENGRDS